VLYGPNIVFFESIVTLVYLMYLFHSQEQFLSKVLLVLKFEVQHLTLNKKIFLSCHSDNEKKELKIGWPKCSCTVLMASVTDCRCLLECLVAGYLDRPQNLAIVGRFMPSQHS